MSNDEGAALPAVILVALVLAGIVASGLVVAVGGKNVAETGQLSMRASAAATAGVAEAQAALKNSATPASLCSRKVYGVLAGNGATYVATITCTTAGIYDITSEGAAGGVKQKVLAAVGGRV